MITEHALPKSLCRRGQPLRVLIVGAGGNGSAVLLGLPYLHQAMKVWGHAGGLHVMLADGDLVSETNCVRQPFASADVGLNKAVVLINRVNLFWGLRWQAHPEHFHKDSLRTNSAGPHLIIGCVDTRAARQAILSAVTRANDSTVYWLDLGNNASSGQYVLGQPLNAANRRTRPGSEPLRNSIRRSWMRKRARTRCPVAARRRRSNGRSHSSIRCWRQARSLCWRGSFATAPSPITEPFTTLRQGRMSCIAR